MKIALLGGNGYQYANAPSYVHANGRGYIGCDDLLGTTAREILYTPELAYNLAKDMDARGEPVPEIVRELADEYKAQKGEKVYNIVDKGMTLVDKGLGFFLDRKEPAATVDMSQRSSDNTALIIIGGVGAVAILGVLLSTKKKGRRR